MSKILFLYCMPMNVSQLQNSMINRGCEVLFAFLAQFKNLGWELSHQKSKLKLESFKLWKTFTPCNIMISLVSTNPLKTWHSILFNKWMQTHPKSTKMHFFIHQIFKTFLCQFFNIYTIEILKTILWKYLIIQKVIVHLVSQNDLKEKILVKITKIQSTIDFRKKS